MARDLIIDARWGVAHIAVKVQKFSMECVIAWNGENGKHDQNASVTG
jgi:hypothetical protein